MTAIGRMLAATEPLTFEKIAETAPAAPGLNAVVRIQDIKKNVKPARIKAVPMMPARLPR